MAADNQFASLQVDSGPFRGAKRLLSMHEGTRFEDYSTTSHAYRALQPIRFRLAALPEA